MGNIARIRREADAAIGKDPNQVGIDGEELAARDAWGTGRDACEGLLARKPWQFPVCAVIPTCGSPDLAALCVGLLAGQTVPVYSLVIDTGSRAGELALLDTLRGPAVEIHRLAAHGWRHSAEAVGAAMAMGQAICRSPQMLAIHSDAFLVSPTALESIQGSLAGHSAAGYQCGRLPGRPWADRFLSHSTTLADHGDLLRHMVPWDFPACQARFADHIAGEYDPEFGLNLALPQGSLAYLGQEGREPHQDQLRVHLAAATSLIRHGGLDEPRRGLLAKAVNAARDQSAPLPPWAWQMLGRRTQGSPEPTGAQFQIPEWKPREASGAITFVAPFYLYDPILVDALNRQTDQNWRLVLIHDGPCPDALRTSIVRRRDERVIIRETERRFNDWGHTLRQMGLNMIMKGLVPAEWIVITNGDNYYAPSFVDIMRRAVSDRPALAAYCDAVHNYWHHRTLRTCLHHGEIDCGCLMVRADVAVDVGWRGREVAADWTYCADILERIGDGGFLKVDTAGFVHN